MNTIQSFESRLDSLFSTEFIAIIGCLYTYDSEGFNISLFSKFLKIEKEEINEVNNKQIIQKALIFLSRQKEMVQTLLSENDVTSARGRIIHNALKFALDTLSLVEVSIYFELEKYTKDHIGDENVRDKRLESLKELDKKLYGSEIHGNKDEVVIALSYLNDSLNNQESGISSEDATFFQEHVDTICRTLNVEKSKLHHLAKTIVTGNDILIKQEQAVEILGAVLSIYGLDVKVTVGNFPNFSMTKSELRFPQHITKIPLSRLLELISHEIEVHGLVSHNNGIILGKVHSGKKLQREEGTASLYEYITAGYSIDSLPVNRYFPRILLGEFYTGDTLNRLLGILSKLDGQNSLCFYYERIKRNYPSDLVGVQHKDTAYQRGIMEVKSFLQLGNDVRKLLLGKVSMDEIKDVSDIYENLGDSQKYILFPYMLGEYIKYYLKHKKGGGLLNFYTYIHHKYPFLNIVELIKENSDDVNSADFREKVDKILTFVEKAIAESGE